MNPSFAYAEQEFSYFDGSSAAMPGVALFNAFAPSLSVNYSGAPVAPKGTTTGTVNINAAEWAKTPALGLMIVGQDNQAGKSQAQLIKVGQTGNGGGDDSGGDGGGGHGD
jgi:minor extracellular serine protease Vpr